MRKEEARSRWVTSVTSFVALCIVAASAACGGIVEDPTTGTRADHGLLDEASERTRSSDESERGPAANVPPTSPPTGAPSDDRPPGSGAKALESASMLPMENACAKRTGPMWGSVASSSRACQVMVEKKDPATGFVRFERVDGVVGVGGLADGTLTLRCANHERVLMEIAVRCVTGAGYYEVPAGDIVLGGKASDRTCRVSIDLDVEADRVRGFIDCPNDPHDHDNVFANSSAPIGLGHFDLPE